jgi:hypothetical protein
MYIEHVFKTKKLYFRSAMRLTIGEQIRGELSVFRATRQVKYQVFVYPSAYFT